MNEDNQLWLGTFFLGGFENRFSRCIRRFDPCSPYYQAWFGMYLIVNPYKNGCVGFDDDSYNLDELAAIGLGDQNSWLRSYHVQEPLVDVIRAEELDPRDFHPEAKVAFLGEMNTNSDLDRRGSNDWRYNTLFGIPCSSWTEIIEEHHEMLLRGYYVAWNWEDTSTTAIIYGCVTARAEKKDGTVIDNWERLEEELKKMIRGVEFRQLPEKTRFSSLT
ncbi:MAG: hypothetical protein ACFFD4_16820 [Candidatus Odinarchaeota archaeon]